MAPGKAFGMLSLRMITFFLLFTIIGGLCRLELFEFSSIYRKIPNISPGLITFQRLYLGGLYSGGGDYNRGGGLYLEGSLCQEQKQKDKITLIVIQCYLEKHKN